LLHYSFALHFHATLTGVNCSPHSCPHALLNEVMLELPGFEMPSEEHLPPCVNCFAEA